MRKLFLAVLVLVSVQVFGQNPTNYLLRNTRERLISGMYDSMFRIPRYNGTPSGVRVSETSAIDGAIAMDTTNHRMYIFSGNAWVRLAAFSELGGGGGIGAFQDSVANVRDFGAVGNGSTEDSTAFKNAIATGRPVFVPKGVYKISATLILNINQSIFGTGNTSVLYTTSSKAVIKITDSSTVQNLAFRGTGRVNSFPSQNDSLQQMGVWINGSCNRVVGNTFYKISGRAVWAYSFGPVNQDIIASNTVDSSTVAFNLSFGGSPSGYMIYSNNNCEYNYCGFYGEGGANMINVGNDYSSNTYSMYWTTAPRSSVTNCQFNHSEIVIGASDKTGGGMLFSDCSFYLTGLSIGTLDTAKYVTFSNCRFAQGTITGYKADSCYITGGYFLPGMTTSGVGIIYQDIANSGKPFSVPNTGVTAGTGISITGAGSQTSPFIIDASQSSLQQDTISIASFGAGGGQAGDTTSFSTSTIYGSFYNDGSDTLVITSIRAVLQGSSPSLVPTVYFNDSINVTAGATKLVNSPATLTNTATGASSTPDNKKIPPGVWVWVKTETVTAKPTYFSLTIVGYKKRK